MKTSTKAWLMTAAALIFLGAAIFTGVMIALKWDFLKLSTIQYETVTHAVDNEYRDIAIVGDTACVILLPAETDQTTVTCYEQARVHHEVSVENGVLKIAVNDTRKWYEHIGISFESPTITVELPVEEYGALSVSVKTGNVSVPRDFTFGTIDIVTSTGHITENASASGAIKLKSTTGEIYVKGASAGALDLTATTGRVKAADIVCDERLCVQVSTGKTSLENITCAQLSSSGTTGDLRMTNVTVAETLTVERDTGDVTFEKCDAGTLCITTSTGDIEGTLLTDKVFAAKTSTGKIDVPKTTSGGLCECSTSTGNITVSIV